MPGFRMLVTDRLNESERLIQRADMTGVSDEFRFLFSTKARAPADSAESSMVCMLFNLPNLTDRARICCFPVIFQTTTLNSSLKKAAMDWTTCLVMPIYAPSVRHAMCG